MYTRLVTWLSAPGQAHRLARVVFVLTLPALWSPLACDDFGIAARLASDPLSAYAFTPRDHEAARR